MKKSTIDIKGMTENEQRKHFKTQYRRVIKGLQRLADMHLQLKSYTAMRNIGCASDFIMESAKDLRSFKFCSKDSVAAMKTYRKFAHPSMVEFKRRIKKERLNK